MKYHQKDKKLLNKLKTKSLYVTKEYRTAGKVCTLITEDNKICIPRPLQETIVNWYHKTLCHPGVTWTELSVFQHLIGKKNYYGNKICSAYHTCQMTKARKTKYSHLPTKEVEVTLWDVLCINLIEPNPSNNPTIKCRHCGHWKWLISQPDGLIKQK